MSESIDRSRAARRSMFYPKADLQISPERMQSLRRVDSLKESAAYCEGLQLAVGDALARAYIPRDIVDIAPLAEQGTFHRIFRVRLAGDRSIIARIAIPNLAHECVEPDADDSLLIDAWAHDRLRRAGLPGLEVFAVDVSRRVVPFGYELLAEAPGRSLREFDHDDALMQPLLKDLGRRLAQMHALRGEGAGLMYASSRESSSPPIIRGAHETWPDYILTQLDAHLAVCRNLGAINGAEARQVESLFTAREFASSASAMVLLHGDLGNHNIFTDGRRITQLIDWEDCLYGDPVFDLAFWATFHPQRRHDWLLSGYREFVPLDFADERRFHLYFLRISLAKTVLRHRLGIVDLPGRPPASQRIQQALAALGLVASQAA